MNKSAMEKALQYKPDELVHCPFDHLHRVPRNRLEVHISSCSKRKNKNLQTCPFNALHIMHPSALREHVKECPNRSTFDVYCHSVSSARKEREVPQMPEVPSEESWDDLPDTPAYNPLETVKKKDVLRCPTGLNRAGRDDFRLVERDRLRYVQGVLRSKNKSQKTTPAKH